MEMLSFESCTTPKPMRRSVLLISIAAAAALAFALAFGQHFILSLLASLGLGLVQHEVTNRTNCSM